MAIYRLSEMVRMRREALGMTQDELIEISDGVDTQDNVICSTDTLRRIEKGRITRVKNEVFKKIMMRFGVLPERVYSSIFVMDSKALNLKAEIHVHICRNEFKQAEKKLERLETMMMPDYPRNQQYLMGQRATLAYKQGELAAEKYLEILWSALRLTVTRLDEVDIARWPFDRMEFEILFEIVNVYHTAKEKETELEFLLKLKNNIEKKYMDQAYYVVWQMHALIGLSQLMCMTNQYKESTEYCLTGIEECQRWRILGSVYRFFYDLAWGRAQQIKSKLSDEKSDEKSELLIKKERAFCRKQLVQAYYLSVAQSDLSGAERVKKLYENLYPDEVKLP
ncbi:MAG: helix-turn-helix domain-containing protein [Lachnospiraceae bacterium]|jgi:transcriptional regulator with XRE-family HTH domain|nr:helix-turn-helix domain-containing protein [Lachnospiraceae bacterium]